MKLKKLASVIDVLLVDVTAKTLSHDHDITGSSSDLMTDEEKLDKTTLVVENIIDVDVIVETLSHDPIMVP